MKDGGIEAAPEGKLRRWHYEFAHAALHPALFAQPDVFLSALNDDQQSRALISAVMAMVAKNCGLSQEESNAIADSIKIHRTILVEERGLQCFVLEMPPPVACPECYFVAIVFTDQGDVRYFTLERGLEGFAPTVLCSWTADGTHNNYGEGPSAHLDSFIDAIGQRMFKK